MYISSVDYPYTDSYKSFSTDKSLPEGLILASTNPQYDDRLFMKIVSSEHA